MTNTLVKNNAVTAQSIGTDTEIFYVNELTYNCIKLRVEGLDYKTVGDRLKIKVTYVKSLVNRTVEKYCFSTAELYDAFKNGRVEIKFKDGKNDLPVSRKQEANYENQIVDNWLILTKKEPTIYDCKCLLCGEIYTRQIYSIINNRSRSCSKCYQSRNKR